MAYQTGVDYTSQNATLKKQLEAEADAVKKAYAAYHELGGNGTITGLVGDMREMEVET